MQLSIFGILKIAINCNKIAIHVWKIATKLQFLSDVKFNFLKITIVQFYYNILKNIEQLNIKRIAIIATQIPHFILKILAVAIGLQWSCNKIAIVETGIATAIIDSFKNFVDLKFFD